MRYIPSREVVLDDLADCGSEVFIAMMLKVLVTMALIAEAVTDWR